MNTVALVLLLFALPPVASVNAQSLDPVFDPQGTVCSISTTPGIPFTMYIVLRGWHQGLGEVNFRLLGLPSDWAVQWTAHPLATAATSPIDPAGATIQFTPVWQVDPPRCLVLYTLDITPTATAGGRILVAPHMLKDCLRHFPGYPSVVDCPAGSDLGSALCTMSCVQGRYAQVDGGSCIVAVQPDTWSRFKVLYR